MAQRFLDDIRTIFDVDRVFLMASVWEDAVTQFERCGLPFWVASDSAFDEVVAADCLRFTHGRRLIDERAVEAARPF